MPDKTGDKQIAYIAANVRRLRLRHGFTQDSLAEAASVDLTYLQRVERGTANPSARVLVALAEALGVSIGHLFRQARIQERPAGRPKGKRAKRR